MAGWTVRGAARPGGDHLPTQPSSAHDRVLLLRMAHRAHNVVWVGCQGGGSVKRAISKSGPGQRAKGPTKTCLAPQVGSAAAEASAAKRRAIRHAMRALTPDHSLDKTADKTESEIFAEPP